MSLARMLRLCPLAFLVVAALGGCTRTPGPLAPVSGKVSYKGAHLFGGLIVFTPDTSRGGNGPIVFAKVREDGSYTLYTGEKEGASAGPYRVSVAALAPLPFNVPATQLQAPISLVPEKYRDPEQSLLTCEIKAERTNQLDFNLD